MVRSEHKYHTLWVWVFDFARSGIEREGNRRAYRCSSPAKRPSLDRRRAAQLSLSSPIGKEDRGRENREGKDGAAAADGLELQLGEAKGEWRPGGRRTGRPRREDSGARWGRGDRGGERVAARREEDGRVHTSRTSWEFGKDFTIKSIMLD
jgi:hypothetical protein